MTLSAQRRTWYENENKRLRDHVDDLTQQLADCRDSHPETETPATPITITCRPADGILATTANTIAAIDRLAATLPHNQPWQIDVAVGRTVFDTIHLTATPGPEEAA